MLSVPAPTAPVPPLGDPVVHAPAAAQAAFAPPDTDQGQFEADKRAVYKYVSLTTYYENNSNNYYPGIHYFLCWRFYLNDANWPLSLRNPNLVMHLI